MFNIIENLIFERRLKKKDIAQSLGMTYNTFLLKLKREYPFTLDEALKLKEILQTDLPVETLFTAVA